MHRDDQSLESMEVLTRFTNPPKTIGPATAQYAQAASALAAEHLTGDASNFVLTSVWSGQGTTTAAVEIANCLSAKYDLRVLIVEVHFARPALQTRFDVPPNRTLAAFASGGTALAASVFETNSGISILPCGTPGFDWPAALRDVVERAIPDFDIVLIDAPPILESSDALAAASIVPRILLIVEWGTTSKTSLQRAKERVATGSRAKLIGAILTKEKSLLPKWLQRRFSR